MKPALNLLLKMGIAAGLQERDTVVDKISDILQDKMGTDPERAQKIGEQILTGLEGVKEQLSIEQIIDGLTRNDDVLTHKIEELTQAINRLNDNLDKISGTSKK
ncbi:hypothetical protein [Microbacter margulisiae]|uniref:ABC-type transporter Mla subunit MlaD n=1 Tax=Microbacter margulisiae TaxID=1350067 RepID=A0A7W5H2I3_9PORP|nr:hypothetical protein [Microbacter margulisiae]MBB3187457.1 ABC-type transporter Mla subunit MlaD [Microbacter margulisiae]